jgi:hypothetical protein
MATFWKRTDRDVWIVDYRDPTGKRRRHAVAIRNRVMSNPRWLSWG